MYVLGILNDGIGSSTGPKKTVYGFEEVTQIWRQVLKYSKCEQNFEALKKFRVIVPVRVLEPKIKVDDAQGHLLLWRSQTRHEWRLFGSPIASLPS